MKLCSHANQPMCRADRDSRHISLACHGNRTSDDRAPCNVHWARTLMVLPRPIAPPADSDYCLCPLYPHCDLRKIVTINLVAFAAARSRQIVARQKTDAVGCRTVLSPHATARVLAGPTWCACVASGTRFTAVGCQQRARGAPLDMANVWAGRWRDKRARVGGSKRAERPGGHLGLGWRQGRVICGRWGRWIWILAEALDGRRPLGRSRTANPRRHSRTSHPAQGCMRRRIAIDCGRVHGPPSPSAG